MRRAGFVLLLIVAAAAAQDREDPVRVALDAERFAEALALAEAALAERPGDDLLQYQRAQAITGIARDRRRERGYGASIDYLEDHLDHVEILRAYAACCLWGGEEERGLRGIRAARLPEEQRYGAELWLLTRLYRYEEAAAVAGAAGWPEWESWTREEAALRERLRARATRARWMAALGAVLLLGGWALLRRRFRPSSSAPATS